MNHSHRISGALIVLTLTLPAPWSVEVSACVESVDATGMGAPEPGPQTEGSSDVDPLQTFREPLLREGSTLVEAPARLRRDAAQNWWTLVLEESSSESNATSHNELALLPCTRLSEMERLIEGASNDVRFRVSGRIYVYRDRNYFLPSHAVVLSEAQPRPMEIPGPESTNGPAVQPAAGTQTTAPAEHVNGAESQPSAAKAASDDSAAAIARELEQDAGPIARSSANRRPGQTPTPSPSARDAASNSESSPPMASSQTPVQASLTGSTTAQSALQENTALVNRRGKIVRDRSGGWLLVLDADASALADPPLRLLPCMLLEDIEDYARRSGNNSPIIITGQVCLYNGQNFLLPTVYRIPHERSRLTP